MTNLDQLESESIYIFREAYNRIEKLGMLWSLGKDSNVMVWLAKKAFFGRVPFPLLHIDTGRKFPEMYAFRDRYSREWNLNLIVRPCPPVEDVDPTLPPAARSAARETLGLKNVLKEFGFRGIVAGIRRDEESVRAGERVFSPRGEDGAWNLTDQPPEFWNQFNTDLPPGTHLRVHPLLHWTELDIWRYIHRENIPVVNLYFSKSGKRYRSLGDSDITFPIESRASTIEEVIAELERTKVPRRSGRAMDHEAEDGFERRLLESLDAVPVPLSDPQLPLRMPVQAVYKFDERKIVAGRIESGRISVGDTVLFSPSNRTARVASIEAWSVPQAPERALMGQSIGITLDDQFFVERGQVVSHAGHAPALVNVFRANLLWLGRRPLVAGSRFRLRLGTTETLAVIAGIERVVDVNDSSAAKAGRVERNGVAEVVIRTKGVLVLDDHADNPITSRFVLLDDYFIVGGGTVRVERHSDQRPSAPISANIVTVKHRVAESDRTKGHGHRGGILWFTGLSGAGKSTLAVELERALFAKGYQTFLLDGDNVRQGLSADLGFSPKDRAENIRRVGEVAALFAEAGIIVITAFISPYRADRDRIRAKYSQYFNEVYINAPIEICEKRDSKGLYRRARAGEIPNFTGISAPYEPPVSPDVEIITVDRNVDECLADLVTFTEKKLRET